MKTDHLKVYSLRKTITVKIYYKNYDIPLKAIIKYYWFQEKCGRKVKKVYLKK